MLYCNDSENKKCFHPDIIDLIERGRYDKLGSILRGLDMENSVDHAGSTLLHLSAEFGTRYLTIFFIKVAKIEVNAKNRFGETPLLLATRNLNVEQVDALLNAGADIRAKDNNGTSSLMIAEYYRSRSDAEGLLELLVKHVKKICKSNVEIADLLIEAGCRVPYRFEAFRNAEITKIMLERGCPANARDKQYNGNAALHLAVEKNDVESVKVLLQYGADKLVKNRCDSIPFVHAFNNRRQVDFEMLELLLPDDVDWTETKDRSEKMKLHSIFVSADKRILEMFLRRCNVNFAARDPHGRTAIHYLVENENEGVWDLLDKAAFDVDARDNAGSTALHLAATLVNASAMQFLLDKGADANASNHMGRSPLLNIFVNRGILNCQAARYHQCIELLLHRGADVQIVDANRESLVSHSTYFQSYDLHVPILAHLALLEAIGSPIDRFVRNPIMIDAQLRKVYESCKRLVEGMKSSELYGSLTYFQLLTARDDDQMQTYAQIDDIHRILRENSAHNYYARLLEKRLLRARRTIGVRKQAAIDVRSDSVPSTNIADADGDRRVLV